MQESIDSSWASRRHHALKAASAMAFLAGLAGCGAPAGGTPAKGSSNLPPASDARISVCQLMPKEAINAITGARYNTVETNDDGRSTESDCHYMTATDPAGMSITLQWISPSEYSDPAEHLALQRAGMGGAKLADTLTAGMTGGGLPGVRSGPVADLGDEAMVSNMLLTVRRGDYTMTVQIIPTDMMALVTDSTVGPALIDKEKAIARALLAKL
ncbi:MAG: hypothetical protein ABJC74_16225 [Gemmatimonadota bacterium]